MLFPKHFLIRRTPCIRQSSIGRCALGFVGLQAANERVRRSRDITLAKVEEAERSLCRKSFIEGREDWCCLSLFREIYRVAKGLQVRKLRFRRGRSFIVFTLNLRQHPKRSVSGGVEKRAHRGSALHEFEGFQRHP